MPKRKNTQQTKNIKKIKAASNKIQLTNELWANIFTYISGKELIKNGTLVSKQWLKIIHNFFIQAIKTANHQINQKIVDHFQKHSAIFNLKEKNFSSLSDDYIQSAYILLDEISVILKNKSTYKADLPLFLSEKPNAYGSNPTILHLLSRLSIPENHIFYIHFEQIFTQLFQQLINCHADINSISTYKNIPYSLLMDTISHNNKLMFNLLLQHNVNIHYNNGLDKAPSAIALAACKNSVYFFNALLEKNVKLNENDLRYALTHKSNYLAELSSHYFSQHPTVVTLFSKLSTEKKQEIVNNSPALNMDKEGSSLSFFETLPTETRLKIFSYINNNQAIRKTCSFFTSDYDQSKNKIYREKLEQLIGTKGIDAVIQSGLVDANASYFRLWSCLNQLLDNLFGYIECRDFFEGLEAFFNRNIEIFMNSTKWILLTDDERKIISNELEHFKNFRDPDGLPSRAKSFIKIIEEFSLIILPILISFDINDALINVLLENLRTLVIRHYAKNYSMDQLADEMSLLHYAVAIQDVKSVYYLTHYFADECSPHINLVNYEQNTPLATACDHTNFEIVDLLLKFGANVNILPDNDVGRAPFLPLNTLFYCTNTKIAELTEAEGDNFQQNQIKILDLLLANGADVTLLEPGNRAILEDCLKELNKTLDDYNHCEGLSLKK